jgi:hypothetical protein
VFATNDTVEVQLYGTSPVRQTLRVQTLTSSGKLVTNASVSASGEVFGPSPPPLPGAPPGVVELSVEPGRWPVTASTSGSNGVPNWQVTHEITVNSNAAPTNIDLIFPDTETDPLIVGTVRNCDGDRAGSQLVIVQTSAGNTNYYAWLITQTNGDYGLNVLPGQWIVVLSGGVCPGYTNVTLSNLDARADLTLHQPPVLAAVTVTINAVDEDGPFSPDRQISFYSGSEYVMTNVSVSSPAVVQLRPGIWSVSLAPNFYSNDPDAYTLLPGIAWHLPAVAQTNLVVVARHAGSRIEGRIRDEQGRLLQTGYATAHTAVGGTNYLTSASMSSGYFSLNVFPGDWEVAAATRYYPFFGGPAAPTRPGQSARLDYTTPAPQILRVTDGVAKCEFIVSNLPAPFALEVSVTREDGGSVQALNVWVPNALSWSGGSLDEDGTSRFNVVPGRQTLSVYEDFYHVSAEILLLPSLTVDVTMPANVNLVVRAPSTCLPGQITGALNLTASLAVSASTEINGTNYTTTACLDCEGRFCLPMFPGVWTVRLSDQWLNSFGLRSVPPQEVVVPATSEPPYVTFALAPIAGDYREARLLTPTLLPDGGLRLELRGQTALTWRVERSQDLIQWTTLDTVTTTNGVARILDIASPPPGSRFYRAVWVK